MRLTTLAPRLQSLQASGPKAMDTRSAAGRKVYHSARWINDVRPAKLSRDPLCQMCLALGLVEPADSVDHWLAIEAGGDPWANSNLVSLSRACHSVKTVLEQQGKPLPVISPSKPRSYTCV